MQDGEIGEITSIDFSWMLDTNARRRLLPPLAPSRRRTRAGCSCTSPATTSTWSTGGCAPTSRRRVYASGGLRFYGAENAAELAGIGPDRPTPRYRTTAATPFELDLRDDARLKALYLEAEQHDGYVRDLDVFSEGITIEDNLALVVDYAVRRHALATR